jgi:uncharacterized protein (TIGR03437 family)
MRAIRPVLGLFLVAAACAQSDYDVRDQAAADTAKATVERRRLAIEAFLASPAAGRGTRILPNRYGLPKTLFRETAPLSAPSSLEPEMIARNFLRANSALFPFAAPEIDALRLVGKDASGSAVYLAFNQSWNGIDVFNGQIKFTLNSAGQVIHAGADDVVPQLNVSTRPALSAAAAVAAAFRSLRVSPPALAEPQIAEARSTFRNPRGARLSPITAELSIFPMTAVSARLAYRIYLETDPKHWYEILIDAANGALLYRHNLYVHAQARVWIQSPMDTSRQLVTLPDAWLPPAGTVTTGNNVDAYLDTNGDDRPDNVTSDVLNNGRAYALNQIFDFPFGDGLTLQNPRTFPAAAVTNLFYLINVAHDYYYTLGFTEAAGNFQTDNFGKGGSANDAVLAEAQQSHETNNASFAPTAEGTAPKIRMGIFTRGTGTMNDDLDSSYDGQVVIHEYGHGVSNRLVGGKISTSCLTGVQSGALGEGWSDYFSISYFNNPVEGAYLSQDPVKGFRRYSYEGYPLTYEDIGNEGYEVHRDGEIWAATLWDLRKVLGKTIADQLVVNGLKSTPCHPAMTDARDAILAADQAANAGANRARIWQVFARHGLGFSSAGIDGGMYPGIYYNAAYDQPVDLQPAGNPAITSRPPVTPPQLGEQFSYPVIASNPAGGKLAYALTQGPAGMTIDAGGVVRWAAVFTQQRVKITVTDSLGGKVVHGFILTPDTTLTSGVSVTVDGAANAAGYANFTIPSGAQLLQITVRGGSGDVDLDLLDPDGHDYYSEQDGNNETLSISAPKSGRWRIIGTGYTAFSGAVLTAALPAPNLLTPNVPITNLAGVDGSETVYKLTVPPGSTSLTFATSGGTGDVDLYVKYGRPAACQSSFFVFEPCIEDDSSINVGNAESITVNSPSPGDWYVDVSAYEAYTGVTLTATLAAPPTLAVSPGAIAFSAVEAGPATGAQTLAFSDTNGSAFAWTASASTTSGGAWLSVSKASGNGNASLQVSVDQKGLKPGTYQGAITITAPSLSGSPANIGVTLTVTAQPVLSLTPNSFTFQTLAAIDPAPLSLAISNAGGSTLSWTASASAPWLKIAPVSGVGSATLQVSIAAAGLAPGNYAATITVAAPGAANSPAVAQVTLIVTPIGPAIASGGIAGAAGSIPPVLAISPGGFATIYGASFAPAGTARAVQASDLVNGALPVNLAGTCVDLDGKPGYLTYVSPNQINFQVPAVAVNSVANVRVVTGCGAPNEFRGAPATVKTAAASPEFLYWTRNANGRNPVIAVNALTGAAVDPSKPAKAGDVLTIYGISFGPTTPAFPPGVAPDVTASTVNPPVVTLGPLTLSPAEILYAGVSPGIAGLYQLNIRVPANVPDGDQPLTLSLGTFATPSTGFVTVKANP